MEWPLWYYISSYHFCQISMCVTDHAKVVDDDHLSRLREKQHSRWVWIYHHQSIWRNSWCMMYLWRKVVVDEHQTCTRNKRPCRCRLFYYHQIICRVWCIPCERQVVDEGHRFSLCDKQVGVIWSITVMPFVISHSAWLTLWRKSMMTNTRLVETTNIQVGALCVIITILFGGSRRAILTKEKRAVGNLC
jgi:hypothetical protein